MSTREQARLADRVSESIRPLFAGYPPEVQGAVLADLYALFLAGHVGPGVDALREDLIRGHIANVRSLVALYDAKRLDHASGNGGVL